jgi:hypothetical protein
VSICQDITGYIRLDQVNSVFVSVGMVMSG